MPKWISAAFALFLSLQVFSTRGATVNDIINKHVEAMGGRERLLSIKSVYSEAVVERKNNEKVSVQEKITKAHDCSAPLVDYLSKGHTAELVGKQNVNGHACFLVKLKLHSGGVIHYFIDAATWLIVREARREHEAGTAAPELIIDYADYRKTQEGYLFPFKVATASEPQSVLNYEKIEVNKPANTGLYKPR